MKLAFQLIKDVLLCIFNCFNRNDWERITLKIKRKIKIDGLSMTACELIVAILEKNCSALKTSEGICVDTDKSNTPFQSNIPLNERMSDVDAIVELCDRGLLRPYNDKIYRATDKAIKNAEKLRKLDKTRVFFYAPNLVKSFFPGMANEKASFHVVVLNNDHATVVMDSETTFQARLYNRRETEIAIEYLYREKLIENLRFVDKNDTNSGLLTITDSLNLNPQALSRFSKDDGLIRIACNVSQRGRDVARINLKTTECADAKLSFLPPKKECTY